MQKICIIILMHNNDTNYYSLKYLSAVPDPPELLSVVNLSSDAVSLSWLRPARVPGHLRGYRVHRQRLALACEMEDVASCVESEVFLWVNATQNGSREVNVTLQPLLKYRRYRVRVVAWTNAGAGKPTDWMHIHTLAGSMSYTHNGCFALTGENIWHQFRYSETRSKFE